MDNLIYVIEDINSQQVAVVDPAWDVPKILALVRKRGLRITHILLTHSHGDHINGIGQVLDAYDAKLHLLRQEATFWGADLGRPALHEGGDIIRLGETDIELLHTPGHTPGSVCYRIGDQLLTGDTLFVFGCGHCNAGGDANVLFDTLKRLKEHLPVATMIHPGHDYATKLCSPFREQLQGNPFLHFDERKAFVKFRNHIHSRIRRTPYRAMDKTKLAQMTEHV